MVKRLVAVAVMALVALAAPAAAPAVPAGTEQLTISDTTPTPGQTVDITAADATQGDVTVTMNSEPVVLGTAASDPSGVARLYATIPANAALGTHTLVATGTGADGAPRHADAQLTVVAGRRHGRCGRRGPAPHRLTTRRSRSPASVSPWRPPAA